MSENTTESKGMDRAALGASLRAASFDPANFKARERATWLLVSAIVAGLDPATAREALREVMSFAQAYRGAAEVAAIGTRLCDAGTHPWTMSDYSEVRSCGKALLNRASHALHTHPLATLITTLVAALFEFGPEALGEHFGENDAWGEARDARMALRICRRALAEIGGAP
ncbi:MAG: hypothetical protein JWM10_4101 [Myxococcaceae bacterium]|nr:hypothetical protein [Myxococcaceae bacterium]